MRPIAHPTPVVPQVRVSHRKLVTLATILAAAAAGAVTIAVVDDGDSGTGTQSFSRPAPDVRYDGGPNEGTAALGLRSQNPAPRPAEGAAVQVMRPQPVSPATRPQEGAAALAMSQSQSSVPSPRPEEGVAVRSIGR
jgi:hypothetical protein